MTNSEKLCLQWNDFQENLNCAFKELRNDTELSDVTLVSEDGQEIDAHRVILSSSCPFFLNILRKKLHPHPLLLMMGVHSKDLTAIVDFLYSGQAIVENENMESFLGLAKKLRLTGLSRTEEVDVGEDDDVEQFSIADSKGENLFAKDRDSDVKGAWGANQFETKPFAEGGKLKHRADPSSPSRLADSEMQELDDEINTMIGEFSDGSAKRICKQCGKTGESYSDMREHVETIHIAGFVHFCDICGDAAKTREDVKKHKKNNHKKPSQESLVLSTTDMVKAEEMDDRVRSLMEWASVRERVCKVCGKQGQSTSIMRHVERNHIVTEIPNLCENCRKLFGTREALKRHKAKSQCTANRLGRDLILSHS